MNIYVAGPISGLSYDQVVARYDYQTRELRESGFTVYHPMIGKGHLRTELEFKAHGYENSPISSNHAIKERDRWMVGMADVLLLDLTECGDRVSIGTCMELAWADELEKHTVVVMQEDNIHQHAFVIECADIIFNTVDDALGYLSQLGV